MAWGLPIVLGDVTDTRYSIAATHNLTEEFYFDVNKGQMVNFDFSQIDQLLPGYLAVYDFMRFASSLLTEGQRVFITLALSEPQADRALLSQLAERYHLALNLYDLTLPARVITATRDQVDPRIPLVDLTGYFQCRSAAGEKLYHNRNTHWNLEGNALAGMVIAAYLQRTWFATPAALPPDLEACAEEKNRTNKRVSAEDILAFVSEQLLPRINAGVSEGQGARREGED